MIDEVEPRGGIPDEITESNFDHSRRHSLRGNDRLQLHLQAREHGEYIDDSVITTRVKAALFNDPALKSSEIKVETYKGVVQLSGFVSTRAMADKAVADAQGVRGVASLKNDMHLK